MLEIFSTIIILTLFSILSFKNFPSALSLLPALTPLYLIRYQIFGLPTTLLELIIFITILFAFLHHRKKLLLQIFTDNTKILWLSALLIGAIAIFTAPNSLSAFGLFRAYLLAPIFLYFIYKFHFPTEKLPELKQNLYFLTLFLVAFALFQVLTGNNLPAPWDFELRATSIFPYPNALGLFLSPIFIFSFFDFLQTQRKFFLFITIISAFGIFLAQSEGAIFGLVTSLFITLLISKSPTKTKFLGLISFSVISFIALISPLRNKILFLENSGQVRLSQWSETWSMLQDHFLFGSGFGGYPQVFAPYHQALQYEIFQYPHNIFLNFWTEFGLLGLAFILILPIFLLKQNFQKYPFLKLTFFAIFATMFFHGLVDVPFFKNDLATLTWIFLGLHFSSQN